MEYHGAIVKYVLANDSISPQSGVGGCAPRPKKLRDAAMIIAEGIL